MEQEQIVDAVRDWLDGDDWHYEYDAEKHLIKMGITLKSKIKSGRIFVDIKKDCYAVYLCAPISGDKDNLGELLKYVAMANYGLLNGNFEVDVRDGEIRYKTFVNCDGLESLSPAVIQDSIYVGCLMMDRYGDGIAALALGFSDADTEIKKAEHRDDANEGD
jgi:hypothetical protein